MKAWNDAANVVPNTPSCPQRRPWGRFLTVGLATLLIIGALERSFATISYRILPNFDTPTYYRSPSGPIDWDSLVATEHFEFQPCYDGFECAKIKLPLDYFNGTYPDTFISLAITKLPARVSVDDPRYGGPVLINPGGPGGPGALFALGDGKALQTIIDSAVDPDAAEQPEDFLNSERYFDIIGFDPRGIGWSDPVAFCMPDEASFWSWRLREQTEGILGSSDAALGRLWSMNHAYGSSCQKTMEHGKGADIKQYMTTASVARDMLEIVERHAVYVDDKSAQLALEKAEARARCKRPQSSTHTPEPSKLQYWGFSYGTYLGATFASMFPDRVGRLILDGVVNSDDYNNGLGNGSLHDSEKAMSSFYTFCVLSGPDICPLATSNSSAKDIENRVQNIIQSLHHNPIEISSALGPDIITYSDLKTIIFGSIYQPLIAFPFVAQILAAVEARGGLVLEQLLLAYRPTHVYSCPINGSTPSQSSSFSDVAEVAILCSDSQDLTSVDLQSFEEYLDLLVSISPTSGSIWSTLRLKCASWKIKAVHRFGDDFGSKTAHPILWVSNTADPVTPLRSGRIMSERFPGSELLIQDSAGHCSISTPSPCTLIHIRTYFQTGVLPPPHTLCTPPPSPVSLNSTDPNSPFYDADLARMTRPEEKVAEWEVHTTGEAGLKLMEAARGLQRSAADRTYFGITRPKRNAGLVYGA